jgi:hypothetical protein
VVANTPPQPTRRTIGYRLNMATMRQRTSLSSGLARYFTDGNGNHGPFRWWAPRRRA